jgi:hypothetical protein
MTSEPITRFRTIVTVAIVGGGLTLTSCSSSDSSGNAGGSAAVTGEGKLGDTVDQPTGAHGVPACADQPGVQTKTYPCYPNGSSGAQQGSWYEVQNTNGTVMYGKPGGEWLQAEGPGKPEQDLVEQIGC